MNSWFARRIIDLINAIVNLYYRRKYGALAKQLGRPRVSERRGRRFLLIQIDGLSHKHLRQALRGGYMPYLRQMIDDGSLNLAPWRCGVPSTTPAVQAGFMFGNRYDIPGFRWYEKDRHVPMLVKRPDQVREIRARISKGREGILEGGSCYVSIFDGDASLALFTLSTLGRHRFFESVRGMGLFLLFLFSPFRLIRLMGLSLATYLGSVVRRLTEKAGPSVFHRWDIFSPLFHAVSDSLLSEVQTFGVMLDIYRDMPAIFANYNTYDEVAHVMGADHPAAFRALRRIDKRIQQIDRMRARFQERAYDLYLIADHGNSASVPFSWRHGRTLGEHIAAAVGSGVSVDERIGGEEDHSTVKKRYLLDELENIGRGSKRLQNMGRVVRGYIDRQARRQALSLRDLDYDLDRQEDVVVSASGPLAHVYLNVSPLALDLIEVFVLYPQLFDALLTAEGVGALIGRAGDRTVVLGFRGGVLVLDGKIDLLSGPNPLAPYGDVEHGVRQIHRLAHFPHSGDLILLGGVEPDGRMVSFEEQVSTHGGLGGPQEEPFIAWPPARPLSPYELDDALDLYRYFYEQYRVRRAADLDRVADGLSEGVEKGQSG